MNPEQQSRRKAMADYLKSYSGRPLRLMEVCGTHTSMLYRTGVRSLLPNGINMLSGPGCPVCVTPTNYIDKLVEYSFKANTCVLSFGDMLSVPGSETSLLGARARGGHVDFFYAPEQALDRAEKEPETTFILAAVGFETTAPVWVSVVDAVLKRKLRNVKLLTALKTMPFAMDTLCATGKIDGFLCPGHVAVIIGSEAFRPLAEKWGRPMVVGGFTAELLLAALARLVHESSCGRGGLWNEYPSYVRPEGNQKAQAAIARVFQPGNACWRGLGVLRCSGLYLRGKYAQLDAGSYGLDDDHLPDGCRCGDVLTGDINPRQCPFFNQKCTPDHPIGACMVSSEGACRIYCVEGEISK